VYALDGGLLAAVERKSLDNLASTLSDGTLAFQLQRLTEIPLAAIVVEARYGGLFKLEHVNGNWLADQPTRPVSGPLPPKSSSPSPIAGHTPKTGPTASSPRHSPTLTRQRTQATEPTRTETEPPPPVSAAHRYRPLQPASAGHCALVEANDQVSFRLDG
jgi:hypothetical protein